MTKNGQDKSCKTCLYWRPQEGPAPMGACRALPPQVILLGMAPHPLDRNKGVPITDTFFPMTPANEWCGRYSYDAEANRRAKLASIDLSTITSAPSA